MEFKGQFKKVGKFWSAEFPLLGIYTQGRTKKEAALMIKDAIETVINKFDFKIKINSSLNNFTIISKAPKLLITAAIKYKKALLQYTKIGGI